jgi:hypothetical protein
MLFFDLTFFYVVFFLVIFFLAGLGAFAFAYDYFLLGGFYSS